jgi:hypothetical protein
VVASAVALVTNTADGNACAARVDGWANDLVSLGFDAREMVRNMRQESLGRV